MALTQISNKCIICGKKFSHKDKVFYVGTVTLTEIGRTGQGDGGMSWGGSFKKVKEGKLRIQHHGGGCKKGGVCYEHLMEYFKESPE